MDFLSGLNPEQQKAVRHIEGPLLILAGAGSGKTRVVTHRICHLIQQHGVRADSILAVTFTNKAAAEMRERVESILGGMTSLHGPLVSTFHSFCVRLLRRDGAPLAGIRPGFTPQFVIYDDDDQLALIKSIFRNLGVDDKSLPPRQALSRISSAKNRNESPEELQRASRDPVAKRVAHVYELYESGLRQSNALDFDDLLLEAVRLLRHDEATRAAYNARFQFLMIDEYQDTNRTQYELIRLLSTEHSNVCVVGDEDQSIYSWRGADIRNILDFENDFPNATVIRLEQNYRSTKNILEAASTVIANNRERKGKWLWTDSDAGEKITVYQALDAENEALYIADQIQTALATSGENRAAVLYRTNSQSRQIEEALRRYSIPYIMVGGLSFYHRAEIKDVLAYLKHLVVPQDSMSLLRIVNTPARGIGRTTMEQVERHAAEGRMPLWNAIGDMIDKKLLTGRAEAALGAFHRTMTELREFAAHAPLAELLEAILERTGYRKMLESDKSPDAEGRLENLNELLNAAAEASERGEGPAEFLDHAALVSESDQLDAGARVSLLTVHNAKGLEFPFVFLAGLEEGLFPHSRSKDNEAMLEEERRLCYVGMTRAQKRLTMSWARARRKFGGGPLEPAIRSRFLLELPAGLTQLKGASSTGYGPAGVGASGYGYGSGSYRRPEASGEVDLFAERHEVRSSAERNQYTGKTYNSLENISQFFEARGLKPPPAPAAPPAANKVVPIPAQKPVRKSLSPGSHVDHPKYGRGQILRREGEGDDAKVTVMFPGHGLKKLIAKFAGLKTD